MNRWKHLLASLGLATLCSLSVAVDSARAQEAPAGGQAEGEGSGDAVPGYIGVAVIAAGALFVVGKSARR